MRLEGGCIISCNIWPVSVHTMVQHIPSSVTSFFASGFPLSPSLLHPVLFLSLSLFLLFSYGFQTFPLSSLSILCTLMSDLTLSQQRRGPLLALWLSRFSHHIGLSLSFLCFKELVWKRKVFAYIKSVQGNFKERQSAAAHAGEVWQKKKTETILEIKCILCNIRGRWGGRADSLTVA